VTSTLTTFDLWAAGLTILMLAAMLSRWRIDKRWEIKFRTVAQASKSDVDFAEARQSDNTKGRPLAIHALSDQGANAARRGSRNLAGVDAIPQPPRPLKFELDAPRQARPGAIVEIRLTISVLSKSLEQEIIRGASDHVPALVASFSVGSRIIVTLSSPTLTVHTPAIFLSWQDEIETLRFKISIPKDVVAGSVHTASLELFNGDGLCLGAIEYAVDCRDKPKTNREISKQELSIVSWNKIREGRELKYIRVLRYKRIFFSYVREDLERVTVLAAGLELNGTEVVIDRTAWAPDGSGWFEKLKLELDNKPDAILLAWSAAAANKYQRGETEPIHKEISYLLNHRKNWRIIIFDIASENPKLPAAFGDLRSSTMTSPFNIVMQSERYRLNLKDRMSRDENQNFGLPG